VLPTGAAAQLVDAEASASAQHVPPSHPALELALYVTWAAIQAAAAFASSASSWTTPLQTMTPCALQFPVHCALAFAVQLACAFTWHFTLQSMLPSAVHDAWQLPWHFASQVALGGVPVHCPSHVALHDALHLALQSAWPDVPSADDVPLAEQCASHVPPQSPSHLPWHVKVPGFALHEAVQLP
jgi:hypothetical protein